MFKNWIIAILASAFAMLGAGLPNPAEAGGPIWYRNGQQCQRASSGVVICRPIERYGYDVPHRQRYGWGCQRASSGAIVCPGDPGTTISRNPYTNPNDAYDLMTRGY
jgi:hypothetical protein